MERIGIIGMGRMGTAMAARLASEGAIISRWTGSGLSEAPAGDLGIIHSDTLAYLVAASDVLITSPYDDAVGTEVLDAVLALDLNGKLLIVSTTSIPQFLSARARAFHGKGASIMDAPVSGGPDMVEAGTRDLFVGGTQAAVDRALPMQKRITPVGLPVGPLGASMVPKTSKGSMIQAYGVGLRELLPRASRVGIPLETVLTILNNGPAVMAMVQDRTSKMLGEEETVGFTLAGIFCVDEVFRRIVDAHGLTSATLDAARTHHPGAIAAGLGAQGPAASIAHAYRSA